MTDVLITGNLVVQGNYNGFPSSAESGILRDVKASGTGGGASITGYNDRTINSVIDPSNIVTLDSGNVLFNFDQVGTYLIDATAVHYNGNRGKLVLTDSANTIQIIGGCSFGTSDTYLNVVNTRLYGLLTVPNTSDQYKLRHHIQIGVATNGLGVATSSGEDEVYTQLIAIKL